MTPSAPATPPSTEAPSLPEAGDSQVLESFTADDADVDSTSTFDNFDDKFLGGEVDQDVPAPLPASSVAPIPPAAPSPVQAPGSPPSLPAPAEGVPAVAPTPAVVSPATPASVQAPPVTAPAAVPGQDPQAAFTAWRTNAETELAKGHFALPADLAEQAEADPAKFATETLPRLAAKVYLDAVTAAVSAIQSYMPGYIGQQLEARSAYAKAEDDFFSAWPQLNRVLHTAKVAELGRTWRAMNPKATKEDYIKNVGALSVLQLGLPLQATPAVAPAPVVAPPRPHVPLATSAPRGGPSLTPDTNPWNMVRDDDEE